MGGQGSFMIRPDSYLTMRPAQRLHRTEERASRPGGEEGKAWHALGRYCLTTLSTCPFSLSVLHAANS